MATSADWKISYVISGTSYHSLPSGDRATSRDQLRDALAGLLSPPDPPFEVNASDYENGTKDPKTDVKSLIQAQLDVFNGANSTSYEVGELLGGGARYGGSGSSWKRQLVYKLMDDWNTRTQRTVTVDSTDVTAFYDIVVEWEVP